MTTEQLFACLRPSLAKRITDVLAHEADVGKNFSAQLELFLEALEWVAITGDPGRLDRVIVHWVTTPAEGDLGQDRLGAVVVFAGLAEVALDAARRSLDDAEAMEILSTLLPPCRHCAQEASTHDHASRMARLSKELEAVRERLERLDRTKSNFISVAGHELKTRLTHIEGYATMLGDLLPERNEQSLTLLNGVHTGVRRLRGLVDNMLDVSLIDSDLLALRVPPLRLGQIFRILREELGGAASQRSLTLEFSPPPQARC